MSRRAGTRPLSLSIPTLPTFNPSTGETTPIASKSSGGGGPETSSPTRGPRTGRRPPGFRPSSSGSNHSPSAFGSPVSSAAASAPRFPPQGAVEQEPLLISTSWDCTARVWSIETWECLLVLEGHKEAVWCGLVVDGKECGRKDGERSFLTASADKTIIHWSAEGKPIRNFKGASSSTAATRGSC